MTEQEVKDLCAKHMKRLMEDLGVSSDITIYTFYDRGGTDGNVVMETDLTRAETYRFVQITIFYNNIEDEERFIRCMMHELLHVQLAPFEIFAQVWDSMIPESPQDAFRKMYRYALERTVSGLEISLHEGRFKSGLPTRTESDDSIIQ